MHHDRGNQGPRTRKGSPLRVWRFACVNRVGSRRPVDRSRIGRAAIGIIVGRRSRQDGRHAIPLRVRHATTEPPRGTRRRNATHPRRGNAGTAGQYPDPAGLGCRLPRGCKEGWLLPNERSHSTPMRYEGERGSAQRLSPPRAAIAPGPSCASHSRSRCLSWGPFSIGPSLVSRNTTARISTSSEPIRSRVDDQSNR